MMTLAFLAVLATILIVVFAIEGKGEQAPRSGRPIGLFTWLAGGNWPAKIGGALIIVGVGALLRYAVLHIDVPANLKLSAGIVIAMLLGLGSMLVEQRGARRAVSLALGGAAFGVAYLTAYSAFGVFNYLSNPMGLALLGLTSAGAGVFAATRSALSLALLSMVGAYLAPAFAIGDPGPTVVYGYYVGASVMTLIMVALRGWHPLIHLSFLFTLAGGAFFAWTAKYYDPSHASVMLPMLLLLSAVHVAMPVVEKQHVRRHWIEHVDVVYTLVLPAVAVLLAVVIAPDRLRLSTELVWLGVIWTLAALALRFASRSGVAAHAVIAGVLVVLSIAARFRGIPWQLLSLGLSVVALAIAAWHRRSADKLHGVLAGLVVLFGATHVLSSITSSAEGPALVSSVFIERLIGAVLLIVAGAVCRRIRQALDTLLLAVGILWATLSIGIEVVRWELATMAVTIHWMLLLLAAGLWIPGRRIRVADERIALLAIAILVTAAWASVKTSVVVASTSFIAASLAMIGLAVLPSEAQRPNQKFVAALLAPVVAAIWALALSSASEIHYNQLTLTTAALVAIATLVIGYRVAASRAEWLDSIADLFGVAFAFLLVGATLFDIARNAWAFALEAACVAGLVVVTRVRYLRHRPTDFFTAMCMTGVALVLQAHLMRLLSAEPRLNISDILAIKWPALVSLLWAIVGSALTLWSRRVSSRTLWVGGATLLVAAAIKLLLVDFGSLGQLANILAVIAAGAVFLLVGWLAPMPPLARVRSKPDASRTSSSSPANPERDHNDDQKKTAWILAIVVAATAIVFQFRDVPLDLVRRVRVETTRVNIPSTTVPSASATKADSDPKPGATIVDSSPDEEEQPAVPAPPVEYAEKENAPPAAQESEAVERKSWQPPSTIDENGVRTYTQYSSPQPAREQDRVPPVPVAGDDGIEQLLREGRIRRATARDMEAWRAATGDRRSESPHLDYSSGNQFLFKTYVVVREMTYPAGLYGAHSAIFIVPKHVVRPYGNPGHSQVLEMP